MKRFKNILLVCDPNTRPQVAVDHAESLARKNRRTYDATFA